ncbi:MAG: transporter substrate-binding domain-containing protein [Rickettsiales bacterium]|nr:transporter substrate-binding domain-containing protein [Rickettsiales bacterium]
MKKIISAFLVSSALFMNSSYAETIGGLEIEGLVQRDGQGLYDQIINAVGKANGVEYKINVLPPKRLFNDFENGTLSCITPANENPEFYNFDFETVSGPSFTDAKIYLFSAPGTEAINDLSMLAGKKIGVRSGMPLGKTIENAGLQLIPATSIEANIKKLKAGRLDYFFAYWPDYEQAFKSVGVEPFPHMKDAPIAVHQDTVLCRKDKNGDSIVSKINEGYAAIEANGTLNTILGE